MYPNSFHYSGIRPQRGNKDDDSQRSSLMMDEENASSDADCESSEEGQSSRRSTGMPRMGISASTLGQNNCEYHSPLCNNRIIDDSMRGGNRGIKSIQRSKQEHV